MSRSPLTPATSRDAEAESYAEAHRTLVKLLRQGLSWSGGERDCVFLNTGGRRFATVSAVSGLDSPGDGRGLASVDWDRDGDLDLWFGSRTSPQVRLMRNDAPGSRRTVTIKLQGTKGNRDAIGARVELALNTPRGPRKVIRGLRAGEGYMSQGSKWMVIGLGDATAIESLRVRWPGGATEAITGVEPGGSYALTEGSPAAAPAPREAVVLAAAAAPEPATERRLVPLRGTVPLPSLSLETMDGKPLVPKARRPLLLNLWASWCKPCQAELSELATRQDEVRRAGIEVVAVSVDGLGDARGADASAPAALLGKVGFPFPAGKASRSTVDKLEILQNAILGRDRALAVPTTFLVDEGGHVTGIARGAVPLDELLALAKAPRPAAALAFPGRWLHAPPPTPLGLVAQALLDAGHVDDAAAVLEHHEAEAANGRSDPAAAAAELNLAIVLVGRSQLAEARRHLRASLRFDPSLPETHVNLATILAREGDDAGARKHLKEALRLRPGDPTATHNLKALESGTFAAGAAEESYQRGLAAQRDGKADEAIRAFQESLAVSPRHVGALVGLGTALVDQGRAEAALPHFKEALGIAPDDAMAHRKLGIALAGLGRFDAAERHFREVIRIDPDDGSGHLNLGLALMGEGKHTDAEAALRDALKRDPSLVSASGNLGLALHHQGRLRDAQAAYRDALRLDPGYAKAKLNLAWLLATSPDEHFRDGRESVELAEAACPRESCRDSQSLDVLAAAYAEAAQWNDALQVLDRAMDLAADPRQRDRLRERLLLYKERRAVRTTAPASGS